MIYITGDCHGDFSKFSTKNFPEQKNLTKSDYVIICGDFGGMWQRKLTKEEDYWLEWLNDKPFTTLVVDGNHENFDRLYNVPRVELFGGQVGFIRPGILHLLRGEVYNIDGVRVFTFGGASSHDISDGILDYNDPAWREKALKLEHTGRQMYRVRGLTWWDEELPSILEEENAWANLAKCDNEVDLVITHCAPTSIQGMLGFNNEDYLNEFLEDVYSKVTFKHWFFGHYHTEEDFGKFTCLYQKILPWA